MKAIPLLSLLVLLTPLAAQTKTTPAESKPAAAKADLLPNQQAFLNLPEESRKAFVKHVTEATRIFQQKRIIEALAEIEKGAAIFKDSPELYNLRGSCYVEMRAFDKAMIEFNEALALSKDNVNVAFNVGEVYFVTKQWQKCSDTFEKILKQITTSNIALGRLVEFKILLCKKKLGKKDEAAALADKYDYLDDSPYYYYAKAAAAFEDNNPIKADEWLATCGRIFPDPNATAPWKDTLIEYGYIKGMYGNDAPTEDEK